MSRLMGTDVVVVVVVFVVFVVFVVVVVVVVVVYQVPSSITELQHHPPHEPRAGPARENMCRLMGKMDVVVVVTVVDRVPWAVDRTGR